MSVHLVTGRKGEAHISSTDIRSQNRALYGDGVKRMRDISGSVSVITTGTNQIVVKAGSYMWYGMHIKIDEDYFLPVVFNGTQDWSICFNYEKTASGDDYTEEITVTAHSSAVDVAEFTDDRTNQANVIFAEITTVGGVISGSVRYHCDIVEPLSTFEENINPRMTSAEGTLATHNYTINTLSTRTSALETRTSTAEGQISNYGQRINALEASAPQISINKQNILKNGQDYTVLYNSSNSFLKYVSESTYKFQAYKKLYMIMSDGTVAELIIAENMPGTSGNTGISNVLFRRANNNNDRTFYVSATGAIHTTYQQSGEIFGGLAVKNVAMDCEMIMSNTNRLLAFRINSVYSTYIKPNATIQVGYDEDMQNYGIRMLLGAEPLINE